MKFSGGPIYGCSDKWLSYKNLIAVLSIRKTARALIISLVTAFMCAIARRRFNLAPGKVSRCAMC